MKNSDALVVFQRRAGFNNLSLLGQEKIQKSICYKLYLWAETYPERLNWQEQ